MYLCGGNLEKFLIGGTTPDKLLYERFLTHENSLLGILHIFKGEHVEKRSKTTKEKRQLEKEHTDLQD